MKWNDVDPVDVLMMVGGLVIVVALSVAIVIEAVKGCG